MAKKKHNWWEPTEEELEEARQAFEEWMGEDNSSQPDCCVACGNPDYPMCRDSCEMFDD